MASVQQAYIKHGVVQCVKQLVIIDSIRSN